jgi:hypothetical protein
MANDSLPSDGCVSPAQVWGTLTTDCQTRIVRLLAHLAFHLVIAHAARHAEEVHHGALSSRPLENPP